MAAKKQDTPSTDVKNNYVIGHKKNKISTASPYLISEWASAFSKLYEKVDSSRSPEEIWIAAMAHCSSIGEAIRKSDFVELMEYAVRAFGWMLSFSVKCANTKDLLFRCQDGFCEMIYIKFPKVCGHCIHDTCNCDAVDMEAQKNKAGNYEKLLKLWEQDQRKYKVEYRIDDWLEIFKGIYAGRIHLQTMETLGFHFLEEAGEEAFAIRKLIQLRGLLHNAKGKIDEKKLQKLVNISAIAKEYIKLGKGQKDGKPSFSLLSDKEKDLYARIVDAKMDIIVELADTFSFFCSILIKLGSLTIGPNKSLSADLEEALINKYGDPAKGLICPICQKEVCECVFFSVSV